MSSLAYEIHDSLQNDAKISLDEAKAICYKLTLSFNEPISFCNLVSSFSICQEDGLSSNGGHADHPYGEFL